MSFVGTFINKSFTFSISDLTLLQSWFLREGNVVFFSDMILLMVSTLVFFSWISVCICVFVVNGSFFSWICVRVFVFMVYRSLSCSVWLGVSGFPVFSVSVNVLGVC